MPEPKEGEDYEFIPPDFDEDAFIHKELVSFRSTTILFLWGIVAALLAWGIYAAMGAPPKTRFLVGILVWGASFAALPVLFRTLKVDVKHFGRREWLGTGFLSFFSFLAFFLLFVNPPVSDYAPPSVALHASPPFQEPGGAVSVELFVEDNVRVDDYTFTMTKGAATVADDGNLTDQGHGRHNGTFGSLPPGTYHASATANDSSGHDGDGSIEFTIRDGLIDYSVTNEGEFKGAADRVFVKVPDLPTCKARKGVVTTRDPCIRTVRLEMVDSTEIVFLAFDKDEAAWVATLQHAGWQPGNNTFNVVAELSDRYEGSTRFDGGSIQEGPHTITVTGTIGDLEVKVPDDPGKPSRNVPGAGIAVIAVGLVALAALLRRR